MKTFKSRSASVAMLALLMLAPAAIAQETSIKIAVVDLEQVVARSSHGQDLQKTLAAFQTQVQTEGTAMADAAQEIRQRITEGANSLSEEKLTELQKDYEDATIDIRRFQDDKQREGQKMQSEGLQEIEKLLKPVFEAIQAERGYDLILNNVPGVVVMANESVDITLEVVERLNATPAG